MGSKQRTKPAAGRRPRRPHRRERISRIEVLDGGPLGANVVSASLDEVLAALDRIPADLEYEDVASDLVPVFPRVRPYHERMPEPVSLLVQPGLTVGIGIDVGPAFVSVNPTLLERWGRTADEVLEQALANLDIRMAAVSPSEIHDGAVADIPVRFLQSSMGVASSYVLRPAALGRIFGTHPQLLIAPMRNLLMSMPVTADRELAAWLFTEVATEDPNCLAPMAFLVGENRVAVEPLGVPFGRA